MACGRADEALVAATLAGEAGAYDELAARYRDSLAALAFRRLRRIEEARDVAQAALVTAFLKLPALRDPARFGPWVHKIAEALALNATRVTRREVSLSDSSPALRVGPGQAQLAVQDDRVAQLQHSLAALSDPTRRALVLHYLHGHSHAEVAKVLGLTEGAVKTRLSRARRQLRQQLAPEAEPGVLDSHLRLALRPPTRSSMASSRRKGKER